MSIGFRFEAQYKQARVTVVLREYETNTTIPPFLTILQVRRT